jgi:hypothetical protein
MCVNQVLCEMWKDFHGNQQNVNLHSKKKHCTVPCFEWTADLKTAKFPPNIDDTAIYHHDTMIKQNWKGVFFGLH